MKQASEIAFETTRIDALSKEISNTIERRATLITAAVTDWIDPQEMVP